MMDTRKAIQVLTRRATMLCRRVPYMETQTLSPAIYDRTELGAIRRALFTMGVPEADLPPIVSRRDDIDYSFPRRATSEIPEGALSGS